MKKYLVAILVVAVVFAFVSPAWAKSSNVNFGYKSAALSPQAKLELDEMALYLKQYTGTIHLTAYVSSAGDQALNQEFATKRVQAVKAYLTTQGVPAQNMMEQTVSGPASKARMVVVTHGETPPAAMAATPPPAAPTPPPQPAAPTTPPEATPPPPPPAKSEPVITAKPEKKPFEEESILDEKPYSGDTATTPPSRWEY
jgi:hypothetical protein